MNPYEFQLPPVEKPKLPEYVLSPEFQEFDEVRERELTELSEKLWKSISSVLEEMRSTILDPNIIPLEKYRAVAERMRKQWPEHSSHRMIPSFPLEQIDLRLKGFFMEFPPATVGGELGRMPGQTEGGDLKFGLIELYKSKSPEEFSLALEDLLAKVFHEVEHFEHWGSAKQENDKEGIISYLGSSGEMWAHAKQYAAVYVKRYPHEPFDLERVREFRIYNVKNYFTHFADPEKQEKYKHIADLGKIHHDMVALTVRFVKHLNGTKE